MTNYIGIIAQTLLLIWEITITLFLIFLIGIAIYYIIKQIQEK